MERLILSALGSVTAAIVLCGLTGSFLWYRRRLLDGTAIATVRRMLARTTIASNWLPYDAEVYDTGLGSYVIKSDVLPRGNWMYFRKWKTIYGDVRYLCVTTPNSDGYLWGMDFDPVAWHTARRAERVGTLNVLVRKVTAASHTRAAGAGKQLSNDRAAGHTA